MAQGGRDPDSDIPFTTARVVASPCGTPTNSGPERVVFDVEVVASGSYDRAAGLAAVPMFAMGARNRTVW